MRKQRQWIDSVAQLVEHYTFNVGVLGSNPSGITKPSNHFGLRVFHLQFFYLSWIFSNTGIASFQQLLFGKAQHYFLICYPISNVPPEFFLQSSC